MKNINLYKSIMIAVKKEPQSKSYDEITNSAISFIIGGAGLFGTGSFIAIRTIQTVLLDTTFNIWFY